jgi:hypothetical protein
MIGSAPSVSAYLLEETIWKRAVSFGTPLLKDLTDFLVHDLQPSAKVVDPILRHREIDAGVKMVKPLMKPSLHNIFRDPADDRVGVPPKPLPHVLI